MRLFNCMSVFKRNNKVVPKETTESIIPNEIIDSCEPVSGNKVAAEEGNRISLISNKVVPMKEYDQHSKDNLFLEDKSIQRVNSIVIDERSIIKGEYKDCYEKLLEEHGECPKGNLGFEDVEYKNDEYLIGIDDQAIIESTCEDINDDIEKANDNEWRQITEAKYTCLSDFEKVFEYEADFNKKVEFILNQIIKLEIDINLAEIISFIEKIMKPTIVDLNRFGLTEHEQFTLLSIIYHISEPFLSEQLIENQKRIINHEMILKPKLKDDLIEQLSINNYQKFYGFKSFRQEFSAEKELLEVIEDKYLKAKSSK